MGWLLCRSAAACRLSYFCAVGSTVLSLDAMPLMLAAPIAQDSAMLDIDEAIDGVHLYRQHGGGTLVSPTQSENGRDPHAMRRISLATGVPVIMGQPQLRF